jgi:hypothetical protein
MQLLFGAVNIQYNFKSELSRPATPCRSNAFYALKALIEDEVLSLPLQHACYLAAADRDPELFLPSSQDPCAPTLDRLLFLLLGI